MNKQIEDEDFEVECLENRIEDLLKIYDEKYKSLLFNSSPQKDQNDGGNLKLSSVTYN